MTVCSRNETTLTVITFTNQTVVKISTTRGPNLQTLFDRAFWKMTTINVASQWSHMTNWSLGPRSDQSFYRPTWEVPVGGIDHRQKDVTPRPLTCMFLLEKPTPVVDSALASAHIHGHCAAKKTISCHLQENVTKDMFLNTAHWAAIDGEIARPVTTEPMNTGLRSSLKSNGIGTSCSSHWQRCIKARSEGKHD